MRMITKLRRLGPVDVFGPISRRPLAEKLHTLQQYRFALVFENDLYPGYVTEKVFDAWYAATIPLYWGLDSAGMLNGDAIVNMAGLAGPDELIERVRELDKDPARLDERASLPLLRSRPSTERIASLLRDAFKAQGVLWRDPE